VSLIWAFKRSVALPDNFDKRELQHRWGRMAGEEWRGLSDLTAKRSISAASEWIFRRILQADDPRSLIGETAYNGSIFAVERLFQEPYYCGYLWQGQNCGFFCSVKKTTSKFVIEQVFEGQSFPQNNRVQHV
jgi:hypothetical protein